METTRKKALWLGIFVLLADVLSKAATHIFLPLRTGEYYPYHGVGVFRDLFGIEFSIIHATNRGAAWGAFAEYQHILLVLRIILIIGMLIYLLRFNRHNEWILPLTLVITGAFSNVLDTFIYGHVVDMFHFILWGYDYPVFNVADSAICIGIFWLILSSFLQQPSEA